MKIFIFPIRVEKESVYLSIPTTEFHIISSITYLIVHLLVQINEIVI